MKKIILLISIIIAYTNLLSAQSGWVKTSVQNIGGTTKIAIIGFNIFVVANDQLLLSTDNGVTWTPVNGLPFMSVASSLATDGTDLFVQTRMPVSPGVYKSSDLGLSWTDISPARSLDVGESLLIDQNYIYAGATMTGIYKSTLAGISSATWASFDNGLTQNLGLFPLIKSLKILGPTIIAGAYGSGVFISPTNSPNWMPTSGIVSGANYITSLCVNDSVVLAGNVSGTPVLYRSIDSGHTWNPVTSTVFLDMPVNALSNNADTIFAGSTANGVLISLDNGITWAEYNDGLKDNSGNWVGNIHQKDVNALLIDGGKIYAATADGVWTRSLLVVLPVKLVSFDAAYKNGSAYLSWKTATESNLKKFEIEKSVDGNNFKKIGEVKAVGNTSLAQLYNFLDNTIEPGYNGRIFFRLKQIDFDGKFSYSPVSSIKIKHGLQQIQVYPNPAKQQVNLQVNPIQVGLNYHITNASGQPVISGKISDLKTIIDIRKFDAGIYFLQIEEKNSETIKFLKE